jgi:branched-chain amino acid aminotransferase
MLAILDGTVLPAAEATVPATDEGLLRGDGVFEVIRLYGGRPFAFADHLARMARSAANLRLPFDGAAVRADAEALLEAADAGDAVLRLVVTRGGRRLGLIEPLKALPDTVALQTITYSPTRVLDGVKSLSYGANMLAGRLARERGADEALLVTPHGRVLEGPTMSLFCSLDGETLVTPPLEDHILDSITRRRLMAQVEVAERPVAVDELGAVREAFLASTLREVHPVRAIDGRALPDPPGPLTRAAAERMRAHIEHELAAPAR